MTKQEIEKAAEEYSLKELGVEFLNNCLGKSNVEVVRKIEIKAFLAGLDHGHQNPSEEVLELVKALELIAGPVEFYCAVGDRNSQAIAKSAVAKFKVTKGGGK